MRSGILFLMLFFLAMFRELKNLLESLVRSAGFALASLNATDIRQPFCEEGIHVSYFVYTHPNHLPTKPHSSRYSTSFPSMYHFTIYITISE